MEDTKVLPLVVCLEAGEYEGVDLHRGRLYETLPDTDAKQHKQVRVVDDSGEDYLFPVAWFAPVEITETLRRALVAA